MEVGLRMYPCLKECASYFLSWLVLGTYDISADSSLSLAPCDLD